MGVILIVQNSRKSVDEKRRPWMKWMIVDEQILEIYEKTKLKLD